MGVQPIPTDPIRLPPGTVGLILGRASLTLQGLTVMPGIVDAQHTPQLQVLAASPQGVFSISKGDRIAQLLLLPGAEQCKIKGDKQIGSSGTDSAYLMISLRERPRLVIKVQGKRFEGILDTGADKSIISSQCWPKSWPVTESAHPLQGLGYQASPTISSASLRWESPDGTQGWFTPYVLPLPPFVFGPRLFWWFATILRWIGMVPGILLTAIIPCAGMHHCFIRLLWLVCLDLSQFL